MSDETKNQASEQEQQKDGPPQPGAEAADKLQALQQELDGVRKEKDETFARLQRVYADFSNFQKRVPKQITDAVAYERERLLKSLLPLLDNFERTLKAEGSTQNVEALIKGVEIIRDQMLGVLKTHGVEPIQAVGEKFDPERHEAMLRKSEPSQPDDVVLEEYQRGFKLDDRILRPSRVAVNKVQPKPKKTAPTEDKGTEASEAASK
ncbi:MAG: nucleotide exchange factor GrpE [Solirubrobacterales bacterium]